MTRKLFVYYRIPKADIALGMSCANQLMISIKDQGLGTGALFQREETDKPYFTLMEVIQPATKQADNITEFSAQIEQLATTCFALLPTMPGRHTEIFSEVGDQPCA